MRMKGADIIIDALIMQGVDTVFGYPGGTVIDIYDALYKRRDEIHHVVTAHEQGAAHAADGYFRATGKVGVCFATSGPGATNLVTGIATAMLDSIPMVAITGNVARNMIGRDSFQEIDITGITLHVTKHNFFVNDVKELADTIQEAFQIAQSGRPGPVLIDVPKDVQNLFCDYEPSEPLPRWDNPKALQEDIDEAIRLIDKSKKPYIYLGGGAIGAGIADEIVPFAEKIDAFIGCSLMGISAIDSCEERFLGMSGMHGHYASSMAQDTCDLMLAIGVRFSDRTTGNKDKFAPSANIIQLDIDFAEIGKNVVPEIGIYGDIADAFRRIASGCAKATHGRWAKTVHELCDKEATFAISKEDRVPKQLLATINDTVDADTVIATDVGQHQMWAAQYLEFHKHRKIVTSGGLGTMGFGLGAAIGAQLGSGHKVVLVTGDGSFGMNLTELATAVTQHADVTIVLFNNGVLGMVRQWQTLFYDGRHSNTTLHRETDFVALAKAFGADAYHCETPEEFQEIFPKAFAKKGPVLVECMVDPNAFVLPMVPPGGCIEDLVVERTK